MNTVQSDAPAMTRPIDATPPHCPAGTGRAARARWSGACAGPLLLAAAVLAQERPDPATDPELSDPAVDARAREMTRRPTAPALSPSNVGDAGGAQEATAYDSGAPPVGSAPLRREGTFLVRQRGSMVRLRNGEWLMVFHRDAQGKAERPMVLVRSANLARMEQLGGTEPEAQAFIVTGQVLAYRGVNYLLPTAPPVLARAEPRPAAPEQPASTPAAPGSPEEPGIDELIRSLEAQLDRPRGLGLARAPEGPPPAQARDGVSDRTPTILPEGSMLIRRRGRLVRTSAGDTALAMDADADAPPSLDPPMILAPCLLLERMERVALDRGEVMTFEVTGRVLAYQGRNYLLPTMFRVYPPGDVDRRH